jgi:hypothetical protein
MKKKKKKKKKKIKSRRHISSSTLFPKKEAYNLMVLQQALERAFPDPEERKEYVENFLKNIDNEKYIPDEQIGAG